MQRSDPARVLPLCWDGRKLYSGTSACDSLRSPWAYIGHKPFVRLVSDYDLKVNYKPVLLVDQFSGQGRIELLDDALKSGRKPYSSGI
ncbi:hypothetical protein [Bradyrhizobium genosp. P]|uniref:hypothetical protein n=1 Tax=Bradyrhizobium genosp. P TaxID=83641 RepID=UPI003CF12F35